MPTGIWLFIYGTGICLFIYDTSICLLPGWMVVWWLTGGLVLIGKVRYECSGAEGREETKQQRHGTKTPQIATP